MKYDVHIVIIPIVWNKTEDEYDNKTLEFHQKEMDEGREELAKCMNADYIVVSATTMNTMDGISIVYTLYLQPDDEF